MYILLYGKRMQEFLSVGSLESNIQYFSVKFRPGNFATVPQEQKCFLLESRIETEFHVRDNHQYAR